MLLCAPQREDREDAGGAAQQPAEGETTDGDCITTAVHVNGKVRLANPFCHGRRGACCAGLHAGVFHFGIGTAGWLGSKLYIQMTEIDVRNLMY